MSYKVEKLGCKSLARAKVVAIVATVFKVDQGNLGFVLYADCMQEVSLLLGLSRKPRSDLGI